MLHKLIPGIAGLLFWLIPVLNAGTGEESPGDDDDKQGGLDPNG